MYGFDAVTQATFLLVDFKLVINYCIIYRAIADKLKTGHTIEPESYKEASVYFSDIVGFTSMCSQSTPMQVVDFLNDLWTVFDDIIAKYSVYKVSDTITMTSIKFI